MPNLARPIWVLALLAVVALAACGSGGGSSGPGTFTTTYPPTASGDPVAVSLIDQAGVITGIDMAIGAAPVSGVEAVPGQPMTLRVSWVAGECTDRVTMVLNSVGAGYEITIHNHEGITAAGCTPADISRALNVAFNKPVVPDQLAVTIQFP